MKEKRERKSSIIHYLLFGVICLQILCFVLTFVFNKQVFHEDEFFSYALANSSGRPFIYGSKVQVCDNYNSWETGDSFRYYIRTKQDTTFDYANVWANQNADTHPPFYYALLHTISSFFPEKFSWWWGFLLNLALFAVTQVFLYKWSKRFAKSEYAGLAVCIFYGFTIAALNTVMFIRMYEMLTMFVVMLVYFGSKAADADKLSFKKHLLPVSLTILGGALTQHTFLIFAFVFTVFYCLFELCKKRFRNMFLFGIASFVGAILSFAVFPASVKHMFYNYEYSTEIQPELQSFYAEHILVKEMTGYDLPLMHENPFTYITILGLIIIVIMVPLLFLFRKELRLKERLPKLPSKIAAFLRRTNYTWAAALIGCVVILWFVVTKISYYSFFDYYDRYMFLIVPLIIAIIICLLFRILSLIKLRFVRIGLKTIVSLALASVLVFQNVCGNRAQYARSACESGNGPINSYLIDDDCILIVSSTVYLPCYSLMLENADDIFITLSGDNMYQEQDEAYRKLFEENDTVFLAFQKDCLMTKEDINIFEDKELPEAELLNGEKEMLRFFEDNYDCSAEYCTMEGTHIDPYRVMLYKLTKK